jgi:hypothetical protein
MRRKMMTANLIEIESDSEVGYWRRRAEEELELARRSTCEQAGRFRFTLAGLYFDRYYSTRPCG